MIEQTFLGANPNIPGSGAQAAQSTVNSDPNIAQVEDWNIFLSVKVKLNRVISSFKPIQATALKNRGERYKDLNIDELRENGKLKRDEFMIPMRAIDLNIRREHPLYMNYVKNSRRLMIFHAIKDQGYNSEPIENEFTRVMTYSGWEIPQFKVIDGAATHGWDSVEVVMDDTKPGGCGVEHIGNDMLVFPTTSQNIQFNEVVMRKFVVYPKQLRVLGETFGFNTVELNRMLESISKEEMEKTICIYKAFYRIDGVVWVAWFSESGEDWLKLPAKLFLGRKKKIEIPGEPILDAFGMPSIDPVTGMPVMSQPTVQLVDEDELMYPLFILPYYETEKMFITDHVGRVFLDKHKQEAKTANISQFLNGCQRASGLYPYLTNPSDRGAEELENVEIKSGTIPPIPISYFQLAYPDQTMLNLQNYLDIADSQEAGQPNFTVNNRQDSRKTATEVQAAQNESNQLNSVQTMLYSTFLRELYTFVWGIIKSKAINNEIVFLWNEGLGRNEVEKIDLDFELKAAGDIDVIKRAEQLQQYQTFWPIISQTPVALRFLADMLRLAFPLDNKGEVYATELLLGDPTMLIQQLVAIINTVIDQEDIMSLTPDARLNMQNVLMQAQGLIARSSMANLQSTGASAQNPGPEQTLAQGQNNPQPPETKAENAGASL